MSDTVGTLEQLAGELARVFEPLARRVEEDSIGELLPWLGLRSADIDVGSTGLDEALATSARVAATLEPVIAQLAQAVDQDDRVTIATSTAALLQQFRALLQAVEQIVRSLQSLGTNPALTPQQRAEFSTFAAVFSERLLNRLFVGLSRSPLSADCPFADRGGRNRDCQGTRLAGGLVAWTLYPQDVSSRANRETAD